MLLALRESAIPPLSRAVPSNSEFAGLAAEVAMIPPMRQSASPNRLTPGEHGTSAQQDLGQNQSSLDPFTPAHLSIAAAPSSRGSARRRPPRAFDAVKEPFR
jgi:hypothetical protein